MKKIIITLLGITIAFSSIVFFTNQPALKTTAVISNPYTEAQQTTPTPSRISEGKSAPINVTQNVQETTHQLSHIDSAFESNINTISQYANSDYCLNVNEQNQCTVFTLETNYKHYFYDENLKAIKATPILALLSADNFHEVMLNMNSLISDHKITIIEHKLNTTLDKLKQQGLAIHAQPVRCGDYLCAIDLGEITQEASKLSIALLHDSDPRLANIFTNQQRIIFSLDGNELIAKAVTF